MKRVSQTNKNPNQEVHYILIQHSPRNWMEFGEEQETKRKKGREGEGLVVVREGPRSATSTWTTANSTLMLSLNSISQFLVPFICGCVKFPILHRRPSEKPTSRGAAMITRSNLVEQLREYQIRSKHDWASASFFSSTSNITSSRYLPFISYFLVLPTILVVTCSFFRFSIFCVRSVSFLLFVIDERGFCVL